MCNCKISGALIDSNYEEMQQMFTYAVETVNNQEDDLENRFTLKAKPIEISFGNEFDASQKLCKLLRVNFLIHFLILFY